MLFRIFGGVENLKCWKIYGDLVKLWRVRKSIGKVRGFARTGKEVSVSDPTEPS